MLPLGQTVWLWRRQRGLTQAALAKRAGIPRPNLSAIERDRREVSVRTVRALAAALALRPGLLVDGLPPDQEARPPLSRATMERIADAVAFGTRAATAAEQEVAEALRVVLGQRTALIRRRGAPRTSRRAVMAAWAALTSRYGREALQSFADRIAERQRASTR